jgi:hypothetical protein
MNDSEGQESDVLEMLGRLRKDQGATSVTERTGARLWGKWLGRVALVVSGAVAGTGGALFADEFKRDPIGPGPEFTVLVEEIARSLQVSPGRLEERLLAAYQGRD